MAALSPTTNPPLTGRSDRSSGMHPGSSRPIPPRPPPTSSATARHRCFQLRRHRSWRRISRSWPVSPRTRWTTDRFCSPPLSGFSRPSLASSPPWWCSRTCTGRTRAFWNSSRGSRRGSRACPCFLLALARPEFLDARPGWARVQTNVTVQLEALTDAHAQDLVLRLVSGAPDPETVAKRVEEAAAGNPLFIEELAAWLWRRVARMPPFCRPTSGRSSRPDSIGSRRPSGRRSSTPP